MMAFSSEPALHNSSALNICLLCEENLCFTKTSIKESGFSTLHVRKKVFIIFMCFQRIAKKLFIYFVVIYQRHIENIQSLDFRVQTSWFRLRSSDFRV